MGWYPCCCLSGITCNQCTGNKAPEDWEVGFSGIALEWTGTGCPANADFLNTNKFILSHDAAGSTATSCRWNYEFTNTELNDLFLLSPGLTCYKADNTGSSFGPCTIFLRINQSSGTFTLDLQIFLITNTPTQYLSTYNWNSGFKSAKFACLDYEDEVVPYLTQSGSRAYDISSSWALLTAL